ncbi:phycobiliprotein lyase [Vacuolonema iberomarrocanum]|uniref:phycobiliprotein lyase n=1 Tax=Vacuolonema iberomarrocanum TaxID=3454632 RepID=UPI001A0335CB|nr:phycobiliprotein lyase [filamentous cyanobacterium LEGE 07170]
MISTGQSVDLSLAEIVAEYFRQSAGEWESKRRYYTLKSGDIQEVVSQLTVRALEQGCPELKDLARKHGLTDKNAMLCGAYTTWESNYVGPSPKTMKGSTVFGVIGDLLYRDRGFSTSKPVTAKFQMRGPTTMCLRTEYGGNSFEEEIKLVGTQYRTRQTIITRAGEEQMIGQYLETRKQ